MNPGQSRNPLSLAAVRRHRRRWLEMNSAPAKFWENLRSLVEPLRAFKQCFLMVLIFERCNEVRPWIPTSIVEVWIPKAAVADQIQKWRSDNGGNPLVDTDTYMRLTLPPGTTVTDLLTKDQVYPLDNDDWRIDDILHLIRRSTNRELFATGQLAAKVDAIEEEQPNLLAEFAPHAAGVILPIVAGIFYFMTLTTGGG